MKGFICTGLASLITAVMCGIAISQPPTSAPVSSAPPVEDLSEHDPLDLVFDEIRLRGKTLSVRAFVKCLDDRICILDLPPMIDAVIGVRIEGLPPGLRSQIYHRFQSPDCPQLLTGYFTGYDLLVTEFRLDCSVTFEQISSTSPQPSSEESPTVIVIRPRHREQLRIRRARS